jgi:hypothetical protein
VREAISTILYSFWRCVGKGGGLILRVSGVLVSVVLTYDAASLRDWSRSPVTGATSKKNGDLNIMCTVSQTYMKCYSPNRRYSYPWRCLSMCFPIFLCTVISSVMHRALYQISKETPKELVDATVMCKFAEIQRWKLKRLTWLSDRRLNVLCCWSQRKLNLANNTGERVGDKSTMGVSRHLLLHWLEVLFV